MGVQHIAVRVRRHPARVTVYNLHLSTCRFASSGDPEPTTLAQYALGKRLTRAEVPASTGWVFGEAAAGGNPRAPVWFDGDALRFTCGHCLKDLIDGSAALERALA
jgi:hypothetical protein